MEREKILAIMEASDKMAAAIMNLTDREFLAEIRKTVADLRTLEGSTEDPEIEEFARKQGAWLEACADTLQTFVDLE